MSGVLTIVGFTVFVAIFAAPVLYTEARDRRRYRRMVAQHDAAQRLYPVSDRRVHKVAPASCKTPGPTQRSSDSHEFYEG